MRVNKRRGRGQRYTFRGLTILFGVAVAIILYISNNLAVDQLADDVYKLRAQHAKVLDANAILKAEISRKTSLERIGAMARASLGLVDPSVQPEWFNIDNDKMKNFGGR